MMMSPKDSKEKEKCLRISVHCFICHQKSNISNKGCGLCMFSAWVSSRCSSFLPQSKGHAVRPIGDAKLGVYLCVCPVIDWRPVQAFSCLSSNDRRDKVQQTRRISGLKDGQMKKSRTGCIYGGCYQNTVCVAV